MLHESPEGNLFPYVTSLLYIFLVICLRSPVLSTNSLHVLIHVTSRQMQTLTIGSVFNDNCHLSCEVGLLVEVEKLLSNKMSLMKWKPKKQRNIISLSCEFDHRSYSPSLVLDTFITTWFFHCCTQWKERAQASTFHLFGLMRKIVLIRHVIAEALLQMCVFLYIPCG